MTRVEQFADEVYGVMISGGPSTIPESVVPATHEEGLAVQLAVLDRFRRAGSELEGWKVALSTGPSQDRLSDPDRRPFGFILRERTMASGATLDATSFAGCLLEPELCFVLGKELRGPDVTPDAARDAVSAVAPAFEINDLRSRERPLPVVFADNLAQWGIVVGSDVPVTPELDLSVVTASLFKGSELVQTTGPDDGPADHFETLARVCRQLDDFGLGLLPGQRVITGAYAYLHITGSVDWAADFGPLGRVSMRVVA